MSGTMIDKDGVEHELQYTTSPGYLTPEFIAALQYAVAKRDGRPVAKMGGRDLTQDELVKVLRGEIP